MNKEKIIDYLEHLEWEARQSDKFFIERNELHIENQKLQQENKELKEKFLKQTTETYLRQTRIDKAIDFIENRRSGHDWYDRKDLLEILKGDVDD